MPLLNIPAQLADREWKKGYPAGPPYSLGAGRGAGTRACQAEVDKRCRDPGLFGQKLTKHPH